MRKSWNIRNTDAKGAFNGKGEGQLTIEVPNFYWDLTVDGNRPFFPENDL